MKIYLFWITSLLLVISGTGCKKAEDVTTSAVKPEKILVGFTGGNSSMNRIKVVHLYKDTVYLLMDNFIRFAGEQLIIDEGTLIKVKAGGQLVSIIINPGGVITANGNASQPIIFTSNTPAGNQTLNWDGITIRGNASNNLTTPNGNASDNSGTLNYVRIEFARLVLNGVGNLTTINNVQVSY